MKPVLSRLLGCRWCLWCVFLLGFAHRVAAERLGARAAGPAPDFSRGDALATGRISAHARAELLRFDAVLAGQPALDEQGRLRLFLQTLDRAQTLVRRGYEVKLLSATIAQVSLAHHEVYRFLQESSVQRVDGIRRLRPLLDQSGTYIGAQEAHRTYQRTGQGVLVGIIDTGVDFRHADFLDQAGKTRIDFLLSKSERRDQRHPEIPDYGGMQVVTAHEIDELLDFERRGLPPAFPIRQADVNGHGTHVAGIAASTGLATSGRFAAGRYAGIAPAARLCVVKATADEISFDEADVLWGVSFCLDRARESRQPVVLNLSLGGAGGAHDGQSLFEQALDELIGDRPGNIAVAAAGNDGSRDLHASASLLNGHHTVTLHVQHTGAQSSGSGALFEVYYDAAAPPSIAGAAEMTFELTTPGGQMIQVAAGQQKLHDFGEAGHALIDARDLAASGSRGATISLHKEKAGAIQAGDWRLTLHGRTRRYDVWHVVSSDDVWVKLRGHLDPDSFVGAPASARSVISVGAVRSRLTWPRQDGRRAELGRELFRVAPFSSGGPLRDGRFAPDLLAPGEFVLSALSSATLQSDSRSSFYRPNDPGFLVADDGLHAALRGTSQAAPHVTGAIALLLEHNPRLTPTEIRELLRTTTRLPLLQGYGPRRGFGELDLPAALHTLTDKPREELSALLSDVGVNRDLAAPGVDTVTVTVTPRSVFGRPLGPGLPVSIASDRGEWLGEVVDTGYGRYERTLFASALRGQRATIEARVGDMLLAQQPVIHFAAERSEVGAPFEIGACAFAATSAHGPPAWLAPLVLWLLHRAGRRNRPGWFQAVWLSALLGCQQTADAPLEKEFSQSADFFWAANGPLWRPRIDIHLRKQQLDLFDAETLVASTSVSSGRRHHVTPRGLYHIQEKILLHLSTRYGDYIDQRGNVVVSNINNEETAAPPETAFRGTPMPYFLRLDGGIGVHAGNVPGFRASHGCVRLPPLFAKRLYEAVAIGTSVNVTD